MPGTWLRRFVVFSVLAATGKAAPALTEIQDVLYKADGTLFDGIAQIEWKAFQAANGTEVPQNSITVRVNRGNFRVSLVPTTNALRPSWYTIRFNSDGRTQWTEYWSVPPSLVALRLQDVRTGGPVIGNLTSAVNITDVTGLRNELDLRPTRGPNWATNRIAVIGVTGGIDAVAGNAGDCVHVDGTSGPCGTASGNNTQPVVVYVDSEAPSGTIDGVNLTFRLVGTPSPVSSLRFFRNGLLQSAPADYTISGNTITIAAGRAPVSGDLLQAWYRLSGTDSSLVDAENPTGSVNGINNVFTLAWAPSPLASLQIYRNGVLQKQGADYTVASNIVTFYSASTPQPGDVLRAVYRK